MVARTMTIYFKEDLFKMIEKKAKELDKSFSSTIDSLVRNAFNKENGK